MEEAGVVQKVEEATVGKRTFIQRVFVVRHFFLTLGGAFIALAVLSRNTPYFPFDLVVTKKIQNITFPGFAMAMILLTGLGSTVPATLSIIFNSGILFALNKRAAALTVLISSLGLSAIGVVVKELVLRPRPNSLLVHQLGHFVKPDSFPSGHVLHFMGLYGFLAVFIYTKFKKSYLRAFLLVSLVTLLWGIGVSRIFVGAHWFSDVLGSYLVGLFWLYYITSFYNKYEKKETKPSL